MTQDYREIAKTLAARPYAVRILRDDSDVENPLFLAMNPELEGCMTQGETQEEAERNLEVFRIDYIEHLLENDLPIPYPMVSTRTTDTTLAASVILDLSPSVESESSNRSQEQRFDFAITRTDR